LQRVRYWVMAFRPKTLTAAIVPIFSATALVFALKFPIDWTVSFLALLASICIQIGTNLVNDAVDFKKGADTEKRLGPQRVTQSGLFSGRTVMMVAGFFFFLAVLCGAPLVLRGGWPILLIGIFSVLFGYGYTAGPFPLAYRGLGDFFVVMFFGLIAVTGLFYLHTFQWRSEPFILGLQVGFHCAVLIAVNNLRDIEGDRLVNKKTLPVRFGKSFARYEIAVLCFLPFVLQLYWWQLGFLWAAIAALASIPLAIIIVRSIFLTEPSPIYNQFLGKAAGLHLLFAGLLSLGFLL
jgi:1,4-dihydroxy-2-naphthoate polyprenyltransferase